MSGSGTIYTEQSVLGHTLGFRPMAFLAQVFVGLCSAAMPPSETVGGIEAFGGGYTRMLAQFALIDTPANIAANVASVEFPIAAAGWGTLGFFELWDAPAGGNRLYWGALIDTTTQLPTTITVSAGDIVRFSAGTLAVQAATGSGGTSSVGAYLPLAGGTLLGPLLLASDPTTYLQAATKQYVDAHSGTGGGPGFLPLSGGTMLGALTLAGNATTALQAVPLQQVGTINVINVLDHGAKGDGSTNDYSAIQGVLNSVGGKATIFIPNTGQPYMTDPLSVPSGTDLLIQGTLKLRPGAAHSLVSFNGASNVSIRGHGTLDGNGSAQSVGGAGTLGGDSASNVQIERLTIQNAYNWNVDITRSSNVRIDRVTISGGANANEFAQGCDNCWITNSTILGPSNDGGFVFYGGVTNSGITNCVVKNAFVTGISVYSDTPQPAPCANIVIANNVVYNNNTGGIAVQSASVPAVHTGITITSNRCYANNNIGNHLFADVWIDHGKGVTVAGNDLSGSGSGANATYGVFVGGASSHVNITGNTIWNEGQGGTAGGGVYIQAATDVLVEANHFYDDQTTHTMTNAVLGNAGARNTITGNLFGTLGGTPITLVLAADTIVNVGGMLPLVGGTLTGELMVNATGIGYNGSNAFAFTWSGTEAQVHIDGGVVGYMLTDSYVAAHSLTLQSLILSPVPPNAANDAGAATAGVPVGGLYRNGSALQVRVA